MTTPDKNPDPLRVLLVEDSFQSMNLTKGMLHDLGITQIFTAKNGVEALNLLGTFDGEDFVDVVLCDWNMPEMTGIELLRQVRSCDPDLLFIMITGEADRSSIVEAKAFGVNGYIKKPFSSDELRKKLDVTARIINHRKLETAMT
jgi:two-component system chemotaxis response regulator CheY